MTHEGFEFDVSGGRPATGIVVVAVWVAVLNVLIHAVVVFGSAMWLVAIFTLPALYDLLANPKVSTRLGQDAGNWFPGSHDAIRPWDQVRRDTRLDLSLGACFVLITSRKLHLPIETTPPHVECKSALAVPNIKTEHLHVSLVG
ncbi:MAG: hypothetical protein ABJ246_15865 [Paracoccaceae bacterium]